MATPSLLIIPDRYKAAKLYSQLPESGDGDFTVTRSTTATRVNASGLIESVASGVPRLDYTGGGCPSLLVEPAATNLLSYSEEFDDAAWSKTIIGTGILPTVSSNAATAPDGTSTADRVTFNLDGGTSSSDASAIIQTATAAIGTYTRSVYLKSGDSNTYDIIIATTTTPATFLKVTVTPQWQRFSLSAANTSANPNFWIGLRNAGGVTGLSDTAVIDCWGAQLEEGSVATSYIPTVASTVTRNADVISLSSVSGLIGQTEGYLYAEVDLRNFQVNGRILAISDGTNANRVTVFFTTSNRFRLLVTTGGAGQVAINSSTYTAGKFKLAVAYAASDFAIYINGVQVGVSASGSVPACPNVYLGTAEDGSANALNDRIISAAIGTTRPSNAELAAMTTL